MMNTTTLTVNKKTKIQFDKLHTEVNDAFNKLNSIPKAFRMVDFFDSIIKFIELREDDFLDFMLNPTDASFWEGK